MGIMRPEIPESALRGQVHFGFWPSGCPSGVQVNLHFATRSIYTRKASESSKEAFILKNTKEAVKHVAKLLVDFHNDKVMSQPY
jgi:hypothetical protein